jgi:hypothetical protein
MHRSFFKMLASTFRPVSSALMVYNMVKGAVFPTTATSDGKRAYVLYSRLDKLLSGQDQDTFTLQEVQREKKLPFRRRHTTPLIFIVEIILSKHRSGHTCFIHF